MISPSQNYISFEKNATLVLFNCSGNGATIIWIVDGNASNLEPIVLRGITQITTVLNSIASSQLSIPTIAENNNTEVICIVADYTYTNLQYSAPVKLILQGNNKIQIQDYCV